MQLINELEKTDATVRKTAPEGESFLSHLCVIFAHEWKDGALLRFYPLKEDLHNLFFCCRFA